MNKNISKIGFIIIAVSIIFTVFSLDKIARHFGTSVIYNSKISNSQFKIENFDGNYSLLTANKIYSITENKVFPLTNDIKSIYVSKINGIYLKNHTLYLHITDSYRIPKTIIIKSINSEGSIDNYEIKNTIMNLDWFDFNSYDSFFIRLLMNWKYTFWLLIIALFFSLIKIKSLTNIKSDF